MGGCTLSERLTNLLRWTSFVAAYLAVAVAFSMFASTVFINALKTQFLLTQSQVDLLLSLEWLGIGATLPAGTFIQKYGLKIGALIGLLIPTGAHLLIWSACRRTEWYSDHYYLLATYFFLAGCGCGISYLVAIATTVRNFSERVRCTVVGVLSSATSVGPIASIFIYNTFFMGISVSDYGDQNIQGYFLFLSMAFLATNLFCVISYGYYPPSTNEDEPQKDIDSEKVPFLNDSNSDDKKAKQKMEQFEMETTELSFMQLVRTPSFHLIVWPAVITLGLGPMDTNNLTTMLLSYGLEQYSTSFPYICSIVGFVGKVFMGGLSDLVVRYFPRSGFVVVACVANVIAFLMSAFLLDHVLVVILNIVVCNLACVVIWCIGPSILIEEFGEKTFVRDWGFVQLGYGVASFVLQYIFGIFYDMYVEEENGTVCYGYMCFLWTFVTSTLLCVIAAILSSIYLYQKWRTVGYTLTRSYSAASLN